MKKLIFIATLLMFTTSAQAEVIHYCRPNLFNWLKHQQNDCVNQHNTSASVSHVTEPPPGCTGNCDPGPGPKVKNNHGHGNGNEGDCSGRGCTDGDNPGNGPKN